MDTPNQPGVKLLFGMQPESTYLQWFETLKNSQSHLAIHPPEIRGGFLYLFQGDYSKRTFKDGRTKYTFKQSESKDISYNGKNYRRRSLTLQDQPVNSPKFILWTIGEIDPNNKKIELPLTLYHYRCDGDDNRSIFTSPEALKAHEDREAQPAPWTHSMVLDTQNTFLPADPDQSSVSSDGQASIDDWLSSYLDPDGTSSLGYSAANSPDSESKKRRLEEYPAQDGWKRFCGSLEVEEIVKAMDFVKHSDVRLKTNIQTIHDALPKVMQLRGVRYQWKDKPEKGDTVGFIAQEVAEIFPEFVHQDKNGYFGIDYTCFMAVLVQALHELQEQTRKELDHHANEITAVKIEVKELTTEVRTEIVDIKTSIGDLKSGEFLSISI
eukprot:TRINITY_DN7406_c0_g1_i1.p1 TRINITY_DN7406_c0_g1~~TRINITY_DN7406_c0_g1_i1.p1  ORF type:complete len:381 (+),score=86.35 TRINITY_DN7406_c0_g1_i1:64-1206(+)